MKETITFRAKGGKEIITLTVLNYPSFAPDLRVHVFDVNALLLGRNYWDKWKAIQGGDHEARRKFIERCQRVRKEQLGKEQCLIVSH